MRVAEPKDSGGDGEGEGEDVSNSLTKEMA